MNCLYCGKGFRLASRIFKDPDFCSPPHRWKFHKRLETAVRLTQREDELHPTGAAGFRGDMAAFDSTLRTSISAPPLRVHAVAAPAFRLVGIGEQFPLRSFPETPVEAAEPVMSAKEVDRRARLQRVSDMVAQLRQDVERRRQEAASSSVRAMAPVIELKPSRQNPSVARASAEVELPLAMVVG